MAVYEQRTEVQTIKRTVYSLPSQTNWVEVSKVLAACRQAMEGKTDSDDAVQVVADEEAIKFIVVHSDEVDTVR